MDIKNHYLFIEDIEKIKSCFNTPVQKFFDNEKASKKINEIIRSCYSEKELEVCEKFFKDEINTVDLTIMENDGSFKVIEKPKISFNLIHIGGTLPHPSENLKSDKKKIIINKLDEYIENNPDNPITEYANLVYKDMQSNFSSMIHEVRSLYGINYLFEIPDEHFKYIKMSILKELEERDKTFYRNVLNLFGDDIEVPKFKKDKIISDSDMDIIIRILDCNIVEKFDKIEPSNQEAKEWIEEHVDKIFTDEEKHVLTELGLGMKKSTKFYIDEDIFSDDDSNGILLVADTFDVCNCDYTLGLRNASSYVVERLNKMDLSCVHEYEKRFKKWKEEKRRFRRNIKIIRVMKISNDFSDEFKKLLKVMYDNIRSNENLNDDEKWFKLFYEELLER